VEMKAHGSRIAAIDKSTLNELIIKSHRIRINRCAPIKMIRKGDMIESFKILRYLKAKHLNSVNVHKLESDRYEKTYYNTQAKIYISNISYSTTINGTLYGEGQGTSNSDTHYTFISIPMMEMIEQLAPDCII